MSRKPARTRSAAPVRIQKLMADAGVGSRRALEQRIAAGDVLLNGRRAELGAVAGRGDSLAMNGRQWTVVSRIPKHQSLVYNKPLGEVTTRSDPQGRPTVFDRLPAPGEGRWIAVGRLDINTTGLLLLTTDGELAHAMMHPAGNVDREYACRIHGEVDQAMIERLKKGVELEDGTARFSDIVASGGSGENRWFYVTLMEGRNREVRRLWSSQDVTVSRLKLVRYGAVFLPKGLRVGRFAELSSQDHRVLREDVGLPAVQPQLSLKQRGKARGTTRRPRPRQRKRQP